MRSRVWGEGEHRTRRVKESVGTAHVDDSLVDGLRDGEVDQPAEQHAIGHGFEERGDLCERQ